MEKHVLQIRLATMADAKELLAIYAPYVRETAITFEYEVPSLAEFTDRIGKIQKKYPYLVAVMDGAILGFAYAGAFHERAAYDWAVETSVYVKMNHKRLGIGNQLYETLEGILKEQNILNLNACIAYPEEEDEYLTKASVVFHEKWGYQFVGTFHQCGYKFNRWYHMVWMEKHIGEHRQFQPEIRTIAEVREPIRTKYGIS